MRTIARLPQLAGVLLLVACSHPAKAGSPLFDGHEQTYLTLTLAQNTTQLVVLDELHAEKRDEAIGTLQFELDARVLFLAELLQIHGAHPVVASQRDSILCHLDAIRRYREEHGSQTKYPDIDVMAGEALRNLPGCPKCPESETSGQQAHRRPTSAAADDPQRASIDCW